jgi:hypothetical protein
MDIKKLNSKDIGRFVIYNKTGELGKIRSWNDTYIFVVYKSSCDGNFSDYQNKHYIAKATFPENLSFDF